MKKTKFAILILVVGAFCFMTIRVFLFQSRQIVMTPVPPVNLNLQQAAARLSGALRFRTISTQDPGASRPEEFSGLQKYLEAQFPEVHAKLTREIIEQHSLLYTWKGKNTSLKPIVLMAHLDVVPVDSATESMWDAPPFEGRIIQGYIYGRGALDDKGSALAIFEATEDLLSQGYQPARTVYLAFGHNEEVLGSGAAATAALLKSRRVELDSVLDEGSVILSGMVPGLTRPVAFVGTAEKGYMSVRLTVQMEGGHSSMPPRHTAVGVLSKAIVELEKRRVPAMLHEPVVQMFNYIGPEMSLPGRFVFANLWLFGPLVRQILAGNPASNAMIRTTTAPTMIEGSPKENVLPSVASAVVNFRILPGDTTEEILAHVRNTVRDERVKVEAMNRTEASAVSSTSSPAFESLQRTIAEVYPSTVVVPSLVVGATDSRFYTGLTSNVYRFVPFSLQQDDLDRIHGLNERISIDDYAAGIRFYIQYLRRNSQ